MRIGVPKEIKTLEGRVALVPAAAGELVNRGHEVFVQSSAGEASGYADAEYERLGVRVLADAEALYGAAELLIKVKEPLPDEYPLLRRDQILFCYLHLAALPELAEVLVAKGLTAIGWETVEECNATYWVAAASRADGQNNTKWRSTVSLYNRSGSSATVDLHFTPIEGPTVTRSFTLAGNTHRAIVDIVGFVGSTGNGSLKIVSNQPLIVGSRIFNQGATGTFGQFLDGQVSSEGASEGDTGSLRVGSS